MPVSDLGWPFFGCAAVPMAAGIRNLGPVRHTEAAFQGFVNMRSLILAILETARGEEDLCTPDRLLLSSDPATSACPSPVADTLPI